ncbi:MAG: hypothetical protein ACW98D_15515 [Promethearchaeota archaeon]|jgi:DNA-binding Lrp family transcriptional regulator
MGLDYIDKELITQLFSKGRQSLNNIKIEVIKSEIQDVSQSGIRKRFERLKSSDTINVQGNLSVNNLRNHCAFIFTHIINNNSLNKLIEIYRKCPRVFMLAQVTGQYNLLIGIMGEDIEKLHWFINHCGPGNQAEVSHSEILFTSNFKIPKFIPVDFFNNNKD